jgi:ADP-dependent NAD(P)H-hydrate dehydratase / NAD(P)H-hydrate epimerase
VFAPLPTPEEMAFWDRQSMEVHGLRNEMLMENASREALAVLREHCAPLPGKKVLLFAGKGNNGGDAIALGRHLHDQSAEVLVLLAGAIKDYTGVSGYHLRLARQVGTPCRCIPRSGLDALLRESAPPDIVVDGLFGTGFSGTPRSPYDSWIKQINILGRQAFVLALDIPSGLDGLSGKAASEAVRAHATVTFEAAKIGLLLPGAAEYVGKLHVRAIGIPKRVREEHPPACQLLTPDLVQLFPRPFSGMHKGDGGRVCIVGGSPGLTGAPALAALGALRSGAGLVTVACPAPLALEVKHAKPEIMTLPLPAKDWTPEALSPLMDILPRCDALVLGPGMGHGPGAVDCMETLLANNRPPTLLDADALNCLATRPRLLDMLQETDILTPHPGEMARLLAAAGFSDAGVPGVLKDRLGTARAFAEGYTCVLVLKGAGSIIAAQNGQGRLFAALSPFDAPCLAAGGSGDVLSGLTGNLLSRGLSALHAACLGVYWHGFSGQWLENSFPMRGNLASEIADALPHALAELIRRTTEE